jgi:hypothetical protein
MGSEILGNVVPEDASHRLTQRSHGTDRQNRDQHHEQTVLEQILSVFVTNEPPNCDKHLLHGGLLRFKKVTFQKLRGGGSLGAPATVRTYVVDN